MSARPDLIRRAAAEAIGAFAYQLVRGASRSPFVGRGATKGERGGQPASSELRT